MIVQSSSHGPPRIRLRVKPAGRADRVIAPYDGALKLEVRAAPERGRANGAVIRLLADRLGLDRSDVEVVAGRSSQDKTVSLAGVSAEEVVRRLEAAGISAEVTGDR